MKVIEGLFYSKDHEWVKVNGDSALIGITDYAQNALGDIAYIEMPEEDDPLEAGDAYGVIESVKAASDLYSPVSGTIIRTNDDVEDGPELINKGPYENWIIEISLADQGELNNLMNAAAYEESTRKED